MKPLIVIPNQGIGLLKLGMTPKEILSAIETEWSELDANTSIDISKDKNIEPSFTNIRYQKESQFFMVTYQNKKAVEISVDRISSGIRDVILYDTNVFNTEVEELVNYLKKFSNFSYDSDDVLLSYLYEFYDIGINLWREDVFHRKLLDDIEYINIMSKILDDMYRFLYFDMITVKSEFIL